MSLELEVGEVKGKMSGMEKRMDNLEQKLDALDKKLDTVITVISQTRGGWKMLSLLAVIVSALGAGFFKLLGKLLS